MDARSSFSSSGQSLGTGLSSSCDQGLATCLGGFAPIRSTTITQGVIGCQAGVRPRAAPGGAAGPRAGHAERNAAPHFVGVGVGFRQAVGDTYEVGREIVVGDVVVHADERRVDVCAFYFLGVGGVGREGVRAFVGDDAVAVLGDGGEDGEAAVGAEHFPDGDDAQPGLTLGVALHEYLLPDAADGRFLCM